jgi:hypothetical protein
MAMMVLMNCALLQLLLLQVPILTLDQIVESVGSTVD